MNKVWKALKDWFTGDWYRRCSSGGGQAVMEGVMMQGSKCIAVSVRQKDGKIVMRTKPHRRLSEKHRWLGYPIIRGIVNFCVMLYTGVKTSRTRRKCSARSRKNQQIRKEGRRRPAHEA